MSYNLSIKRYLLSILTIFITAALHADERPNILFCIADDWGWPHASAYGDPVVKTPTFDSVAKAGVLFEHAYVSSPSCTPSRGAILAGQYHWQLEQGANLHSELPQTLETYPHILEDSGYHTGYWRKSWGPGRNVGKWKKRRPAGKQYKGGLPEFLKSLPENKPFCFWLGASDPHRNYELGSGKAKGMDINKVELFAHFPNSETVRSDVADYYFEVERFDNDLAAAITLLKEKKLFENTLIVITGDHGMPFPRCKSNLYDCGTRVPLAVQWGNKIKPNRTISDFVSLVDLAPTFLDIAGIKPPKEMTGRSLLPLITSDREGWLQPKQRSFVLTGKERHVPSQEAPDSGGYPSRAIRTKEFLYIHNYEAHRWPNGTPNYKQAYIPGAWYSDTDNGPTKTYIIENRDKDEKHRQAYELCFAKRPENELYDLTKDPDQLYNVAANSDYKTILAEMKEKLDKALKAAGDPRATGETQNWDTQLYTGGAPKFVQKE